MLKPFYFSVSPIVIRPDMPAPFEMYVRVNDRYVLYQKEKELIDPRRLERLRASGVHRLFIRQEQKEQLDVYLQHNIRVAYQGTGEHSVTARAALVVGLQMAMIEDLIESPTNKQLYDILQASCARFADFLLYNKGALAAVLAIENDNGNIAHHGIRVATLSVGIMQKQNLLELQPVGLIVMAAFLHDLEHAHSGLNILRPITDMDKTELALYREHPVLSLSRLEKVTFYDPLVAQIMSQHEEALDGSGFPRKLRASVGPVTLVAVANHFDRYVTFEKMKPKEALKRLLIDQIGRMDLAQMTALQDVLKDTEQV